mmetsp:Transcript_28472/g.68476  ORF Transcript_28472/g.68476 Transcript_28472/m.68476 type:complete len:245 (+) Transcript_28472:215-949(+)
MHTVRHAGPVLGVGSLVNLDGSVPLAVVAVEPTLGAELAVEVALPAPPVVPLRIMEIRAIRNAFSRVEKFTRMAARSRGIQVQMPAVGAVGGRHADYHLHLPPGIDGNSANTHNSSRGVVMFVLPHALESLQCRDIPVLVMENLRLVRRVWSNRNCLHRCAGHILPPISLDVLNVHEIFVHVLHHAEMSLHFSRMIRLHQFAAEDQQVVNLQGLPGMPPHYQGILHTLCPLNGDAKHALASGLH